MNGYPFFRSRATKNYSAPSFIFGVGFFLSFVYAGRSHAGFELSDSPEITGDVSSSSPTAVTAPADPFRFDQSLWNKARKTLESPPPMETVATSSAAVAPPQEEPGFSVDLPYDSGLTITGKKLIAVSLEETRRKSAKRSDGSSQQPVEHTFDMKQELQVRIKGKVGRKITVNVDFDDTKDDKRDISVVYQGDPEELVQEAAFGDITLSLPSTKFVSYSKQVFGVRTRLKYKRAEFMAIGSRTKGITETKRFTGNVKFERKEILDTAYLKFQYYNIAFSTNPVSINPATVHIWMDDRSDASDNSGTRSFFSEDIKNTALNLTGNFDELKNGTDFDIDAVRGLVRFPRGIPSNAILITSYSYTAGGSVTDLGTPGVMKILKSAPDKGSSFTDWEIKTFYSIGQTKIQPDDGQGNFIFRTIDLDRKDAFIPLTNGEILSVSKNVDIDYSLGNFNIRLPHKVADASLYDSATQPTHKFTFLLEYRYKVPNYIIKPNIIFGSEKVSINGRQLTKDVDYFIDYDLGFLTLNNDQDIDETKQIEVTYEFAPFGGQLGQTLVGTRAEYTAIPDKAFVGSTFLYTFAPKPTIIPDMRFTPDSLMVIEGDSRLTGVKIPFTSMTLNVEGEAAQSRQNPNIFGRALVDSMEGVRQEDQTLMDATQWRLASPEGTLVTRPDSLVFQDETFKTVDIAPKSNLSGSDTQQVLNVSYKKLAAGDESSIVQSISTSGRDFSKKASLEIWIQGACSGAGGCVDGLGVTMSVDAGQFNEDADHDSFLDTEDGNKNRTLDQGEDKGIAFDFSGAPTILGAGNGRLDSEDLDKDGILRLGDDGVRKPTPLFTLTNAVDLINPVTGDIDHSSDLNFSGWRFIRIPLNILSGETDKFKAVKQVRVTFRSISTERSGFIRLGKIAFTGVPGTLWEIPTSLGGSTMTVSGINNVDDPNYNSLIGNSAYNDLYGDQSSNKTREQALDLKFILPAGSTSSTRTAYFPARDFSEHRALSLFIQKPSKKGAFDNSPGEVFDFFLQLGSETDYIEYSRPITDNDYKGKWVQEAVNLQDLNDDGKPDFLQPVNPKGVSRIVGNPDLTRVGQMKIGVRNASGSIVDGEVWINEIHVTGTRKKIGNAKRVKTDILWPRWGSVSGEFQSVDRDFQTLTAQVLNQDQTQRSASANFTRFQYLQLSGSLSQNKTVTPAALRTGEAGLVSLLAEGVNDNFEGRGDAKLALPRWPQLGMAYDATRVQSNDLQQHRKGRTYTGTLDYSVPTKPDVIPGGFLTLRPLPESISLQYIQGFNSLSFFPEKKAQDFSTSTVSEAVFNNSAVREVSTAWDGRLGFSFTDALRFSPHFKYKKVSENRIFTEKDLEDAPQFLPTRRRPKSLSQTFEYQASWAFFRWFDPHLSYSVSGTENNLIPTVSSPTAFNFKTLDRTGNGDVSWNFSARDLLPRFRPVQSMILDNSFRIESGDNYENLEKDFDRWRAITPFTLHKIPGKNGKTLIGLLEPLDLPNSEARRRRQTIRNSWRTSGNWSPLDWMNAGSTFSPLKTMRMTLTVTNSDERNEEADSTREVRSRVWPDYIVSIRDLEKMYGLGRWMRNTQWNLRGNRKKTLTYGQLFQKTETFNTDYRFLFKEGYDVSLGYGNSRNSEKDLRTGLLNTKGDGFTATIQVGRKFGSWLHTPSYIFKSDSSRDGTGKLTSDLTAHTMSVISRFDKSYPEGFRVPFTKKVFGNVNRFILDSNLSFERKISRFNVDFENTDVYSTTLTAEYEISKNFRLSFGGGGSLNKNRKRAENGFISYKINSQLVIQF